MSAPSDGVERLTEFAIRARTAAATSGTGTGTGQAAEAGSAIDAGSDEHRRLLAAMTDRPANERWQLLADAIVRGQLADVVPADNQHQQAARAELINAMAHEGWDDPSSGSVDAADESIRAADAATSRIREHYGVHTQPYPAAEPSRNAPNLPLAGDSSRSASTADSDQAIRAALTGQARPGATQLTRPGATQLNRTDGPGGHRHQPTTTRDPLQRG
ncbi:hypothetical protein OHA70_37270 [Kribbella sp. NBC_00382]|uniref:hypothetical protein n=1 Tax=Kribbella sp. NBC_00382 TaxID=2975967 RepID=UPI002E1A61CC